MDPAGGDHVEAVAGLPFADDVGPGRDLEMLRVAGQSLDDRPGQRGQHRDGAQDPQVAQERRVDPIRTEQDRRGDTGDDEQGDAARDEGSRGADGHDKHRDEQPAERLGARLDRFVDAEDAGHDIVAGQALRQRRGRDRGDGPADAGPDEGDDDERG